MSDEETPETGEEGTAAIDTDTDASSSSDDAAVEETSAPEAGKKPRKKAQRKSVWVCIPIEWEEVAVQDDDGTMRAERQPTRYSVTECPGGEGQKKTILRVLAAHQIDPLNYDGVLMFRANPLKFDIDQQLIIRIQGL